MYGYPDRSSHPVSELVLTLPEPVDEVIFEAGVRSPLEVYGPLGPDDVPSAAPRRLPDAVEHAPGSRVVRFRFDEPLGTGRYYVQVYASRLRRSDGSALELYDEDGQRWTGWDLEVVVEDIVPQPPEVVTSEEAPPVVMLDGRVLPVGASELSGERLVVRLSQPHEVSLEVASLSGARPLYVDRVQRRLERPEGAGGPYDYVFTATGPIEDYAWAVYYGRQTEGTIPLDSGGRFVVATALMAPPDGSGNASFDLPVNARLRVRIDGEVVWWGQTRLLPLLVPAETLYLSMAEDPTAVASDLELARLRFLIWRASIEALSLWACQLPTAPTPSMQAYVAARVRSGLLEDDGLQGQITVRLGDHMVSGRRDPVLERLLADLVERLRACDPEAPPPGGRSPMGAFARLAVEALPDFHPPRHPYSSYGTQVDTWYVIGGTTRRTLPGSDA